MILSGNLCNFHILSLNNLANPSTDVFSIVEIKYTIFVNLLTTTRIESYPCTSGNLVINLLRCVSTVFPELSLTLTFLLAVLYSFYYTNKCHTLPHIALLLL